MPKKSSVLTQLTSQEHSLTTLREKGISSLSYKRTYSFPPFFLFLTIFIYFFSVVKKNAHIRLVRHFEMMPCGRTYLIREEKEHHTIFSEQTNF